jgi:hypothetical protein
VPGQMLGTCKRLFAELALVRGRRAALAPSIGDLPRLRRAHGHNSVSSHVDQIIMTWVGRSGPERRLLLTPHCHRSAGAACPAISLLITAVAQK